MSQGLTRIGEVKNKPVLHAIYEAISGKKNRFKLPSGTNLRTKKFKSGSLLGVDHKGYRYVEQNPKTSTLYASRAREGHNIMWIIRLSDNEWIGMVEDGIFYAYKWKLEAMKNKRDRESSPSQEKEIRREFIDAYLRGVHKHHGY